MPELYTIGYEGSTQTALFQTLVYHDVQTLLDIRELPQSRKPGLSKTALGLAAAGFGIQYAHIRALGTPRDIRYQRKIDHDEAAFRAGFLTYLATQDAAMEALVERAGQGRCCLLCYEADVQQCHRLLVADRAAQMSGGTLTPVHLAIKTELPNVPTFALLSNPEAHPRQLPAKHRNIGGGGHDTLLDR